MQRRTCSELYHEEFKWQWGVLKGQNAKDTHTIWEVTAIDRVWGMSAYVGWWWWKWKEEGDQQFIFCCGIDKTLCVHVCWSRRVRRQEKLGNRNQDEKNVEENDPVDRNLNDRGKCSNMKISTLSALWFSFPHWIDCWFYPLSESKYTKIQIKWEAWYIGYLLNVYPRPGIRYVSL